MSRYDQFILKRNRSLTCIVTTCSIRISDDDDDDDDVDVQLMQVIQ